MHEAQDLFGCIDEEVQVLSKHLGCKRPSTAWRRSIRALPWWAAERTSSAAASAPPVMSAALRTFMTSSQSSWGSGWQLHGTVSLPWNHQVHRRPRPAIMINEVYGSSPNDVMGSSPNTANRLMPSKNNARAPYSGHRSKRHHIASRNHWDYEQRDRDLLSISVTDDGCGIGGTAQVRFHPTTRGLQEGGTGHSHDEGQRHPL